MAGYQFIHYEAYPRVGKKSKRSLISVAQEADRDTHSHPHVTTPLKPEFLLGTSFETVAQQISDAADQSTTLHSGKPRKVRKDANVGIGLVASHPLSIDSLHSLPLSERQQAIEDIREWAEDVIDFAKTEFPNQVHVAALHWDEGHPHIHILIGNTEPSQDFQQVHKGEVARRAAQGNDRTGAGKKAGNDALKAEMRRFQDSYHEIVAVHHGQARIGPERRRLSRAEWNREQAQAEAFLTATSKANSVVEEAEQLKRSASDEAALLLQMAKEEADNQLKAANRRTKQALKEKERAEQDAAETAELKKEAEAKVDQLAQRERDLRRFDGFFSGVLNVFGVTKRIKKDVALELAAEAREAQQRISELEAKLQLSSAELIRKQLTEAALDKQQQVLEAISRIDNAKLLEQRKNEFYQILERHGVTQEAHHKLDELLTMLDVERLEKELNHSGSKPAQNPTELALD